MDRASEKQLLTPRDAALYPIKIDSIDVESAGLVASGDLLLVMRVADGRRMAMRAPMSGRMLRMMVSVGDVLLTRSCAMTMREEPGLELPADPAKAARNAAMAATIPDAPWGDEPQFVGEADGRDSRDWGAARSDGQSGDRSNGALGRIQPVKRAFAADSPQARAAQISAAAAKSGASPRPARTKRRYPWVAKNSGEHEAEAPHSKKLWAGLAGFVLVLFILGAIPREMYSEAEAESEAEFEPDTNGE